MYHTKSCLFFFLFLFGLFNIKKKTWLNSLINPWNGVRAVIINHHLSLMPLKLSSAPSILPFVFCFQQSRQTWTSQPDGYNERETKTTTANVDFNLLISSRAHHFFLYRTSSFLSFFHSFFLFLISFYSLLRNVICLQPIHLKSIFAFLSFFLLHSKTFGLSSIFFFFFFFLHFS